MNSPHSTLLLTACALILAGCGVNFRPGPEGNEFFKEVDVSGDMRARAPLTGYVRVAQIYPVEVVIRCEVRRGKDLVTEFGQDILPPHPSGGPEATPFAGDYAYDFMLEQPGRYKFECYTPRDEDNYITEAFTIGPERTPTPAAGTASP